MFLASPGADVDFPSHFKHDSGHHLCKRLGTAFISCNFHNSGFASRSHPCLPILALLTLNPEDEVSGLAQPSSSWVYSLTVIKLWSTLTGTIQTSTEPGRRDSLTWLALDEVKSGLCSLCQWGFLVVSCPEVPVEEGRAHQGSILPRQSQGTHPLLTIFSGLCKPQQLWGVPSPLCPMLGMGLVPRERRGLRTPRAEGETTTPSKSGNPQAVELSGEERGITWWTCCFAWTWHR